MALGDELVLGGPALLLGGLGRQQMAEPGRPADELAAGGQLEALGDGFLGLLHERSGQNHRVSDPLARGKNPGRFGGAKLHLNPVLKLAHT